jgi:hypothetical protein
LQFTAQDQCKIEAKPASSSPDSVDFLNATPQNPRCGLRIAEVNTESLEDYYMTKPMRFQLILVPLIVALGACAQKNIQVDPPIDDTTYDSSRPTPEPSIDNLSAPAVKRKRITKRAIKKSTKVKSARNHRHKKSRKSMVALAQMNTPTVPTPPAPPVMEKAIETVPQEIPLTTNSSIVDSGTSSLKWKYGIGSLIGLLLLSGLFIGRRWQLNRNSKGKLRGKLIFS